MDKNEPDNTDFNRTAPSAAIAPENQCRECKSRFTDEYYISSKKYYCTPCYNAYKQKISDSTPLGLFMRAFLFGGSAAFLSAFLYYEIIKATGTELGLFAILLGLFVGFAVKIGSHHCGGRKFQLLAAVLTYFAISSTFIPYAMTQMDDAPSTIEAAQAQTEATPSDGDGITSVAVPDASEDSFAAPAEESQLTFFGTLESILMGLLGFIMLLIALPFLFGLQNIMGLIIIGIGVCTACVINKPVIDEGPFQINPPQ